MADQQQQPATVPPAPPVAEPAYERCEACGKWKPKPWVMRERAAHGGKRAKGTAAKRKPDPDELCRYKHVRFTAAESEDIAKLQERLGFTSLQQTLRYLVRKAMYGA